MKRGTLLVCAHRSEGDSILAERPIAVLGVGKAAAAARLTALLVAERPPAVCLFGVCGAFPARHSVRAPVLEPLDLCVVGDSVLADEGIGTAEGFVDLDRCGFGTCGPFAADAALTREAARALGLPIVRAATVSTCSGEDRASATIAARANAQVETMESAACSLVCAELGVPLLEIRCVSNRTGDRQRGGVVLREAAARAQRAVRELLAIGGPG